MLKKMWKMLITLSQSPKLQLQNASFVQRAAKNPKIPSFTIMNDTEN